MTYTITHVHHGEKRIPHSYVCKKALHIAMLHIPAQLCWTKSLREQYQCKVFLQHCWHLKIPVINKLSLLSKPRFEAHGEHDTLCPCKDTGILEQFLLVTYDVTVIKPWVIGWNKNRSLTFTWHCNRLVARSLLSSLLPYPPLTCYQHCCDNMSV